MKINRNGILVFTIAIAAVLAGRNINYHNKKL